MESETTWVPGYARQPKAGKANAQIPFLSVLQPRVVSTFIWRAFVWWICRSRLPAIIGQLGLPGWRSWNSPTIASIEIAMLLLFTMCVCACVCSCEHTCMLILIHEYAYSYSYSSVATQDLGFLKSWQTFRRLELNHNGTFIRGRKSICVVFKGG